MKIRWSGLNACAVLSVCYDPAEAGFMRSPCLPAESKLGYDNLEKALSPSNSASSVFSEIADISSGKVGKTENVLRLL